MNDQTLITQSLKGDAKALEDLIKKHQDWIFNVALNFTGDRTLAADLSQEVLIKVVTKLSSFKLESTFKTWVYRIIKNHFLNMKRAKKEIPALNFEEFGEGLDRIPNESLSHYTYEVEEKLLVKEAKISCMKGMLLCLEPGQRLIYIIGELFEFSDAIGSEIMEISKENFRVKLHRARKQLYNFMNQKCGLINKKNPCRCARKTAGFIKMGYVDPVSLHFQKNAISKIEDQVEQKLSAFQDEVTSQYQKLYQEHPYLKTPERIDFIKDLLTSKLVRETFNFGDSN